MTKQPINRGGEGMDSRQWEARLSDFVYIRLPFLRPALRVIDTVTSWNHRRRFNCTERYGRRVQHGACVICGDRTCNRGMRVNPGSLKRELVFVCFAACDQTLMVQNDPLQRERTRNDWSRPLPDQFPSASRSATKAFLADGEAMAMEMEVVDSSPTALNQTLGSLGLQDEAYAEQRSQQTFLRRILPRRAS